jgi:hypothetical protein
MATQDLRAMSVGEILDGAFTLFRSYFSTLIAIAIICIGVPTLLNIYVTMTGGQLERPLLWLTAALLKGLGGLPAAGATVWAISEIYLGRRPSVGDALGYAFGRVWKLFVAGLAKYLIIILGLLLFFVPGIIAACGYAVVVQVVVLEDLRSGTDALGRSWQLTKGYKGKAFNLGVTVFLIIYLPFFAAGALTAMFSSFQTPVDVGAEVVSFLVYPLIASVFTLFYYDLRVRQEAFDLEHLSQQLGGPAAGSM